jgi:hypothetical protein
MPWRRFAAGRASLERLENKIEINLVSHLPVYMVGELVGIFDLTSGQT